MIVDDLAKRSKWVRDFLRDAHIVRVPFQVYPFHDADGHAGLLRDGQRIPQGLVPTDTEGRLLATSARASFRNTVIASESKEAGALFVCEMPPASGATDKRLKLLYLAILVGLATRDTEFLYVQPMVFFASQGFDDADFDDADEHTEYVGIGRVTAALRGLAVQQEGGLQLPPGVDPELCRPVASWRQYAAMVEAKNAPEILRAALSLMAIYTRVVNDPDAGYPTSEQLARDTATLLRDWSPMLSLGMARDHHEILRTVVTVFTLMNTRNVVQESVDPSPALQKARQSRGELPLYRYHVLKVRPMVPMRTDPTGHQSTGRLQALHWTRGHFKRYTAERPLFGKYTGTWWWQPTVAGRDLNRVVEKSYKM